MPQPPTSLLTPAEVSARSGLAVSALHFYERRGLIASTRTAGNQRRYARDVLRRLAFIQAAQCVGVPLAEIASALASLPEGRTPNASDWARLSQRWKADLDARIATLTRLRDDLSGCVMCGCLSLQKCKLYNPDDQYAKQHPDGNLLVEPQEE